MRWFCSAIVALAACGTDDTSQQFQLLLADAPIDVHAPTELLVQIVVVGTDDQEVTIESPNLPRFATLNGLTMRLAPSYPDEGDHMIDLVAHTATDTATGSMQLHITRDNTPPQMMANPWLMDGYSTHVPYAKMLVPICDMEGDNFRFQIDLAPGEEPFDMVPEYDVLVDFAVATTVDYIEDNHCVELTIEFPGLAGGRYRSAVHAVDLYGGLDPYGWVDTWRVFTVLP